MFVKASSISFKPRKIIRNKDCLPDPQQTFLDFVPITNFSVNKGMRENLFSHDQINKQNEIIIHNISHSFMECHHSCLRIINQNKTEEFLFLSSVILNIRYSLCIRIQSGPDYTQGITFG